MPWISEDHNVGAWYFCVSICMLGVVVWLAPRTIRRIRLAAAGSTLIETILCRSEIRMRVGFLVVMLGVAANNLPVAFRRGLMVADPALAASMLDWSAMWAVPSAVLLIGGGTMVVWDAFCRLGGRAAFLLIIATVLASWVAGVWFVELVARSFS